MKTQIISIPAIALAIASLTSCSSDSKTETAAASCSSTASGTAGGYVMCLGSATTATFDLAGGSSQQYVVAPYTLGDIATVNGASTTISGFKIAATSASLQGLRSESASLSGDMSNDGEAMRLVTNHFDRSKGLNQPEWIWSTLKRLDAERAVKAQLTDDMAEPKSNLVSHYRGLARHPFKAASMETHLTTLAGCPTSIPKVDNSATTFSATSSYDGTSFCVVYASDPISDTKTNIQASVATILSAYKDTIYSDAMTTNVAGGYSFNPVIVIVDPTSATMWPKGNTSYSYTGAFSRDATTAAKRPIIYLMDDMTAVQSGISTAKATRLVHATLAHEMQHAIMDYYRNRGTAIKEETVAVDEGIAHTFEDAFGYGADNFDNYVQSYLTSVPDATFGALTASDMSKSATRGGANAFLYFLAQRAGGFTVTNNRPFSGDGMAAIVRLVKQTTAIGPTAIQTAFGSQNLTEQVGQFFGAVFSDNKSLTFAPAAFTVSQYTAISDLEGNKDKIFGLRFNSYRSLPTITPNKLSDATAGFDLKHYTTYPTLITPSATTSTVTLTYPAGTTNNGVAVIRVK